MHQSLFTFQSVSPQANAKMSYSIFILYVAVAENMTVIHSNSKNSVNYIFMYNIILLL